MPCSPMRARLLLKAGKARVWRKTPFTIKLTYVPKNRYMQDITLGVDTGSSEIGSAAVTDEGKVLYMSQVTVRNDITKKMDRRRAYRRARRYRKCRYRAPRWLNRKNSQRENRLSPTMISKLHTHLKEIQFVKSILPVTKVILETGNFDMHKLKDPTITDNKWRYQQGDLYGYENVKCYVRARDKHTCQYCKGTSKDIRLEVHHITYRRNNGSDNPDNLITLCKSCHDSVHKGEISLKKKGNTKELKHATQMNSIRKQLLNRVEAQETYGYITKIDRERLGLPKTHYYDALAIALEGALLWDFIDTPCLYKVSVSKGDYQRTKGIRSEQLLAMGKICGFRKFDKVRYRGKEYFIKGRMSTGYGFLMDIHQEKQEFANPKTPKLSQMKRVGARKTWIMSIVKPCDSSPT